MSYVCLMVEEYKKRRRVRRIVLSWPIVALVCIIAILLGFSTLRLYMRNRPLSIARETLNADIAALKERNTELEKRVIRLQTPAGVEEEIRERFGLRRPDEEVIIIVRDDKSGASGASSQPALTRIWDVLKSFLGFSGD